ncbi:MAG: hypothetical protein P8R42_18175 [Candidatus Binatia bacterium]|nr:hypothetical protein [Candidatus Binatia bacterium]
MFRSILTRRVVPFAAIVLTVSFAGASHAGSHEKEGGGIVAPSEYVEDIETPGDTGGVMDEVDAGAAQAEAAEAASKNAAGAKTDTPEEDAGGW